MKNIRSCSGFTLLEVILTFIIVGIVATMVTTFVNKGLMRTDIPITALQTDAKLQLIMENIIQDFSSGTTYSTDLAAFKARVSTEGRYAATGVSYVLSSATCMKLSGATFVQDTSGTCAYLFVTIKPAASSGVTLSYLFTQKSS